MNVIILPEAVAEAEHARLWYAERDLDLGDAFVAELRHAIQAITAQPDSQGRLESYAGRRNIRCRMIRRFPYHIVFELRETDIVIVAVAHDRQEPSYWASRRRR